MDQNFLEMYEKNPIFELDKDQFSAPIWSYYYNLKSLFKYWLLTKDLVAETIFANSEFFDFPYSDDDIPDDLDLTEVAHHDGDEIEFDFENIPKIQRNLILANIFTLIEKLLRDVCEEIDEEFILGGKGSYIQQYCHFIKNNSDIRFSKDFMKSFEAFGHLRNSFVHNFDVIDVPPESEKHLEKLCGPFSNLNTGTENIHVDIFFKTASDFGEFFQNEYHKYF